MLEKGESWPWQAHIVRGHPAVKSSRKFYLMKLGKFFLTSDVRDFILNSIEFTLNPLKVGSNKHKESLEFLSRSDSEIRAKSQFRTHGILLNIGSNWPLWGLSLLYHTNEQGSFCALTWGNFVNGLPELKWSQIVFYVWHGIRHTRDWHYSHAYFLSNCFRSLLARTGKLTNANNTNQCNFFLVPICNIWILMKTFFIDYYLKQFSF